MGKPENIPASELVEDFDLYPRNRVDSTHVLDLVKALKGGDVLPPVIADAKTKQIVDGFHRRRAYIAIDGDEAEIPTILRKYKSKAEKFEDAVRLNSAHGRKLDRHDQARIVILARKMRMSTQRIAAAIRVTEKDVERLSVRVVVNKETREIVPSKRGLKHLEGTTLRQPQIDAMQSVRSAEAGRLALELTRLIEQELVDWENPQIASRLTTLAETLEAALASRV